LNNIESLSSQIEEKITKVLDRLNILVERNGDLEDRLNKALSNNLKYEEVLESMKEKYKALKIANTITGSGNNSIKETKIEINSLIREVDYCISQLSD
jgi:H2-forming N5,N10-methylenetetrahydromethanopterin dehydrogenase-like enzyme